MSGPLDFVSDLGILAFAVWTLIAYLGMATDAKATLLVAVWLATIPPLGVALFLLGRRSRPPTPPTEEREIAAPFASRLTPRVAALGFAAGLFSAVLAATSANAVWFVVWLGAVAALAVAVVGGRLQSTTTREPAPAPAWPAHVFAALTGLGFAAMALFINRPNGDDTFYVNRAMGVAELNRIPVRDIIFTDERVGAIAGAGLPIDSFSALAGAVGRFVGVHGASVSYYVVPPLMTFFATWALWRLLRSWAPRNVVLCFALGCVFWIYSAQAALTPGSYFLNRMWQGKVVLVAWLIPTAFVLLTRWLSHRDLRTGVLLVAVGVSAIGMTGSAAFVIPLLFGTAMIALLARRDWGGFPLLIGAAAFPLVAGFVASRISPIELLGRREYSSAYYFHEVFGLSAVAAVSLLALWAAPWLARSGPPARLATAVAIVALLLLTPELLPTLNEATHLTTILRRTLWIVPFPALVGLLGALPVTALVRHLRGASPWPPWQRWLGVAAPVALVVGLLVAYGNPVWSSWRREIPMWQAPPAWKVHEGPLRAAKAILENYDGSQAILADEPIMHALGLITLDPRPVNARSFYALIAPEAQQRTNERLWLTNFVEGDRPDPTPAEVSLALTDLRVGLVCVKEWKIAIVDELEANGYREDFRVRSLVCLTRPQTL